MENFNETRFLAYVDNIYIKILHAIMLNKLDTVRHFMNDEVSIELSNHLIELENKNLIEMYEMTNVKSSSINSIKELDDRFRIEVKLISRYVTYLMDKTTKKIISGDDSNRIEKTSYLIFEKIKDSKIQGICRKCKNCGASIDVNRDGKCKYCGSIYNLEDYDWILVKINN